MDLKTLIYPVIIIYSPALLVVTILIIRLANRHKKPGEGDRRQNSKLRRILNILMGAFIIAAVVAMIATLMYMYSNAMRGLG